MASDKELNIGDTVKYFYLGKAKTGKIEAIITSIVKKEKLYKINNEFPPARCIEGKGK